MKAVRIAVSEDGPLDHFLWTKSIKFEILMEFFELSSIYAMEIAISDSRRSPDCRRRLVPLLFPLF